MTRLERIVSLGLDSTSEMTVVVAISQQYNNNEMNGKSLYTYGKTYARKKTFYWERQEGKEKGE